MFWLVIQALCVWYVYIYANANVWGAWYRFLLIKPTARMLKQNQAYYDLLSERDELATKGHILLEHMDLEDGCFTFPDGDTWYQESASLD